MDMERSEWICDILVEVELAVSGDRLDVRNKEQRKIKNTWVFGLSNLVNEMIMVFTEVERFGMNGF